MLLKYELNKLKKIDFVNKAMTSDEVYSTYKPTAFINGCLYDMKTHTNITKVEDENVSDGYLFTNEGIGIHNGKPMWVSYVEAQKDETIQDFISGSPILVIDGNVRIEWGNKVSKAIMGKAYRSAIGFNNTYFFMYCSENKLTLEELAAYMQKQGCEYAINLDGGGSCHLQTEKKIFATSPRKNASWLLAYLETEGEAMGKKVFLGVGHGGNDPGTVANGLKEKDVNLTMALACRDELERHGITVLMSRYKDENDALTEEIKECNAFAPNLAVDIHNNAGGGDGFEVFCHHKGGTSKALAQNINNEVIKIGQNSRGVKTRLNASGNDYYGFIRQTTAPAVIVEGAFLDNKTDVQIIDTEAEQKAFGVAYAKGILATLGIAYNEAPKSNTAKGDTIYRVQVGTYKLKENAEATALRLRTLGFDTIIKEG